MTEGDVVPIFLTVDDVLALHAEQISLFGGARGIRDCNALESAIAQPLATFDGEFLHGDLFEMAAAYAFHIAENQAFVDGNKRAALNAALVFLDINGWVVLDPDSRLFDAMLELANKHLDKQAFGRLLKELSSRHFDDGRVEG